MRILLSVLIGLLGGALSGLVGIGGGVLIVPLLALVLGMSQHQAQGTTLALLVPPIGILAAWTYYKQGYVDLKVALFVCLGFVFGSVAGAKLAVGLPATALRRIFGAALTGIGLKIFLSR